MTQTKKHRSWWKWILVVLALLIVIVGVPLLIDQAYQSDTIISITKWEAADVLAYYGSVISAVIGATVAALTLAATILFNRKQIQREAYLKGEREKWEKIENMVAQALERINPKRILLVSTEALAEDNKNYPNSALSAVQKYQFDCRVAMDHLYSYIGSAEYSQVESLLGAMQDAAKEFYNIAQKEFDLYQLMRNIKARNVASQLIKSEAQFPNTLTYDERILAFSVLEDTRDIKSDSVQAELEKVSEKMVKSYETVYRPLLTMKSKTFNVIYTELEKNADEILRFRRDK